MPSAAEAVSYGDACWSKVLAGWKHWKDEGLTEHRNWWPDLYLAHCKNQGITPDPEMLAYDANYDGQRADLKEVAVST